MKALFRYFSESYVIIKNHACHHKALLSVQFVGGGGVPWCFYWPSTGLVKNTLKNHCWSTPSGFTTNRVALLTLLPYERTYEKCVYQQYFEIAWYYGSLVMIFIISEADPKNATIWAIAPPLLNCGYFSGHFHPQTHNFCTLPLIAVLVYQNP